MDCEVRLTPEFAGWLDGLDDQIAVAAITERLQRVRKGLFGDHKTVGDGVSELRIRYGAGYRAYYTMRGRVVVVVLAGGTKRTQARDIARAKAMAKDL